MGNALRLGDHCLKIGSGATPRGGKKAYLSNGPFALIRSQNVYNDHFSHDGLAYISELQADQLRNVEVKEHDVLLNITGDSVARACQVPKDILPARVNQHVAIIRPDKEKIDPRFLRYFLISPEMQHYMLAIAGAGATRNALTKGMIEGFPVPARPLSGQIAIAGILGALDDKIELNRQTNATLEAMARALFKDWFVNFGPTRAKAEGRAPYLAPHLWDLFPDALDDDGLPIGWRSGELQEIVDLNPRESLRKGDEALYLDMAAVPTSGMIHDPPVLRNFKSGTKFKNGDTLLARITPCLENGKTTFVQSLPDGEVAWGSTEFIVMRAKSPAPPVWSYLLARDSAFRAYAIQSMTGTSGRQRVRTESLGQYPVSIPSKETWQAFGEIVAPLFVRIKDSGNESETLAQTRDLLLPKLMSGEIRLREAERIAEAVL